MISLLICTYDCAELLPRALDSALAQQGLGQDGFEVLVVDDGSRDETPEVLRRYALDPRVRPLRQEHLGLPTACNLGLSAARGELFLRLDADDELLPGALVHLRRALEQNPEAAFAIADHVEVPPAGEAPIARRVSPESLFETIAPGVLFRADLLRRVGGYRDVFWEEYDLYLRLLPLGPAVHVDELLYRYHRRGESMTGSQRARRHGWVELLGLWRLGELRLLGVSEELEAIAAEQRRLNDRRAPEFQQKAAEISSIGEAEVRRGDSDEGDEPGPCHLGRSQVAACFEDKRVCVVGSADTLLERRQGEQIDGHDVVVRLNDFHLSDTRSNRPAARELATYIGRRTDVVVVNSGSAASLSAQEIVDIVERSGARVFLSRRGSLGVYWKLRRAGVQESIKVGSLPRSPAFSAFEGHNLTTGSLTVASLLQATSLKSLYATGFDFYTGAKNYFYNDRRVVDTHHDLGREMEYWRLLLLPDQRLQLDPSVADALERPAWRAEPASDLSPLALREAGEAFEVLDLRALEDTELEIKCHTSHWLVALGQRGGDRVSLEADGEVLYLALPRDRGARLSLANEATRIANPDGLELRDNGDEPMLEVGPPDSEREIELTIGPRLLVLFAW